MDDVLLKQNTNNAYTQKDGVSIIVATYNDKQLLPFLIRSILDQSSLVLPLEIIVVDNGSEDMASEYCKQIQPYCKQKNINLLYFYLIEKGKSKAINHGVSHSSFNYLLFTDADAKLCTNYIETLHSLIRQKKNFAYCGPYKAWHDPNIQKPIWYLEKYNESNIQLTEGFLGEKYLPSGINMVFYKPIFQALGGACEKLNYTANNKGRGFDTELAIRYRTQFPNNDFYFSEKLLVYHYTRPNYFSLSYITKWHWHNSKVLAKSYPNQSFNLHIKNIISTIFQLLNKTASYFLHKRSNIKYKYFQNMYIEDLLPTLQNMFCSIRIVKKHLLCVEL